MASHVFLWSGPEGGQISVGFDDEHFRVTRHRDQDQFSRYFYPWSVVGWIRLAEEDEQEDPQLAAPPAHRIAPRSVGRVFSL